MRVNGNGALRGCCDAAKRARHVGPVQMAMRVFGDAVFRDAKKASAPLEWVRGAKRVSSVTIKAPPQGLLIANPEENVLDRGEDEPAYPTVIQQALNNMRRFSHCVVLTRVGSFYEMYFDQAEQYAPILSLKLAKKRTNAGPVSMAGFPFFQLDRFLKVLVQDMKCYVAISEEFPNDAAAKVKSGGLLFDRKVARVITPGTLIDEKFMNPWENSFLLSVHLRDGGDDGANVGLAWIDLSSGDFFTEKTDLSSLPSVIARIGPREIIVEEEYEALDGHPLRVAVDEGRYTTTYHSKSDLESTATWSEMVEDDVTIEETKFSPQEIGAGNLLLQYVKQQLLDNLPKLRPPIQKKHAAQMMIDRNSIKALEIKQTLRDGLYEGSLLHAIRRTETKGGTRLLCQRLLAPSTSLEEINERLDLVTEFLRNPELREETLGLLRATFDSWRLLQKLSFGRGDADDLIGVARTIQLTVQIQETLVNHVKSLVETQGPGSAQKSIESLLNRLTIEAPVQHAEKILQSIDEDKLSEQHQLEDDSAAAVLDMAEQALSNAGESNGIKGAPKSVRARAGEGIREKDLEREELWIMRPTASSNLLKLHKELNHLQESKDSLAAELRASSGAQTLTLKWTPGLGHIGHLKGKTTQSTLSNIFPGARPVHSTKSTLSFYLPDWTKLGRQIDECKTRIRAEEQAVFTNLRTVLIKRHLVTLRRNAAVLDELDVACGFATLAEEHNWTRPVLDHSRSIEIVGGRHPTVEPSLISSGRTFTSNSLSLGVAGVAGVAPSPRSAPIILVTGPNMAGKSTFLRQTALITLLAQIGSHVPCAHARIGLVDALFSRVGSADDLARERSTFLVEMLETAHILRRATPRSLVVMDEVGRGTTPEDGVAVGFAVLGHLARVTGCRTLFATHFHRLADMTAGAGWDEVECWCSDVVEDAEGGWAYGHRLRRGVNRESHALKVARLAGMPDEVVRTAEEVVRELKRESELRALGNDGIMEEVQTQRSARSNS